MRCFSRHAPPAGHITWNTAGSVTTTECCLARCDRAATLVLLLLLLFLRGKQQVKEYLLSSAPFTLQPLRFDIRKKLTARSDRVKSVDLHPTEPWMVVSLYSGTIVVWNHHTQVNTSGQQSSSQSNHCCVLCHLTCNTAWIWCVQTMVKTFECGSNVPVRTAKFIARKHWIVAGGVSPNFKVTVYVPLLFLHKS